MTYAAGQIIDNDDYNGFVVNNTYNVNSWWAAGSGNSGWGQPALGTVDNGDTILASSWAALVNTIAAAANHTGTTITARTPPVAGNTITAMPNIGTDIESINTNRGNAANTGALNSSWSGSAARTSATGSGNDNWTITWTNTVTFESADQARYFFNAGGLIRIQMHKSSTGNPKDSYWNSFAGSVGTIYISGGINGSQTIGGVAYTGVSVDGASGSYTFNSSAGWYYLLSNGSTQIYQKYQTTSPYTGDSITVTAAASGANLFVTTEWTSPGLQGQSNNSISGGTDTASPFSSFGTAPAVVANTVAPSTSYLSNTWGSTTIAESVSASTSPGPAPAAAEFLLIGGGGGGGSQGGGGGGGMVYKDSIVLPTAGQAIAITIGAGGQASAGSTTTATYGGYPGSITVYYGAATAGSQGGTTTVNANGTIVQAYGGGAGGTVNANPSATIGAAGGPPIFNGSTAVTGLIGTNGTSYRGFGSTGTSYHGGSNQGAGAGGGGAGSAGSATTTPNVQVGGDGYEFWPGFGFAAGGGAGGYSSIGGNPFPSSGTYGGSYNTSWYGGRAGVLAGDRSSGVYNNGYENAQSALANTGSGGGGAAYGEIIYGMGAGTTGGNGGSGAVVLRYPGSTSLLSYSGQWTTTVAGGYVYHYLKTSGSLTAAGQASDQYTALTPATNYYASTVTVPGYPSGGRGPNFQPGYLNQTSYVSYGYFLRFYYAASVAYKGGWGTQFTSPRDMVFVNPAEIVPPSTLASVFGINTGDVRSIGRPYTINYVTNPDDAAIIGYIDVDISGTPTFSRLTGGTFVYGSQAGYSAPDRQYNQSCSFTLPVPPVGHMYILAGYDNLGQDNMRITIPSGVSVNYQLIGGGGAGGVRGGGGGAGGVKQSSVTLVGGTTYTIFIGAGAAGVYAPAGTAAAAGYGGQNSDFTGTGIAVSAGGGGYGGAEGIYGSAGGPGGSGGGGAMPTGAGGAADPFGYGTLGYAGGVGENQAIGAYTFGEAGGGGASQVGENGSYGGIGGKGGYGGAGIVCYDNIRRAGGGGGSGRVQAGYGGNNGAAGYGYGASAGVTPDQNSSNALANTGAGSGGAYAESVGVTTGNGGSGVCVIRYPGSSSLINYTGNYTTQTIGGYVVHTLTSSGSLTLL